MSDNKFTGDQENSFTALQARITKRMEFLEATCQERDVDGSAAGQMAKLQLEYLKRFQKDLYHSGNKPVSDLQQIAGFYIRSNVFQVVDFSAVAGEKASDVPSRNVVQESIEEALNLLNIDFNTVDMVPLKVHEAIDGRALMFEFALTKDWASRYPNLVKLLRTSLPGAKSSLVNIITIEYNYLDKPEAINLVAKHFESDEGTFEVIGRLGIFVWDKATKSFIDVKDASLN